MHNNIILTLQCFHLWDLDARGFHKVSRIITKFNLSSILVILSATN